jgi:hypothetical protein
MRYRRLWLVGLCAGAYAAAIAACGGGSNDGVFVDAGAGGSDAPPSFFDVPPGQVGDTGAPGPGDAGDAGDGEVADRSVTDGGTGCTSDPRCVGAKGGCFVLVPGSLALGTTDFCIAQFEMKGSGGPVTSAAVGLPATEENRANASGFCKSLGPGADLPTNAQWQTLARNIELVPANWSGGAVGSGALNRGHSDANPNVLLSVGNVADPCDQTGNPGCASGASPSFSQKRTHVLSTGSVIWDVAGNVGEWVGDDVTPTAVFSNFAGRAAGTPVGALVGPSGTYAIGPRPDVSSTYPSNGLVLSGSLAVIEGQNFESGTIWVQAGGAILVRASNFSGSLEIEPNAGFLDLGSNMLGSGPRVCSGNSVIDGDFSVTMSDDIVAASCGGTCPAGTQTFSTDGSLGLGYAVLSSEAPSSVARGGHLGYGPMAGVFTAIASPSVGFLGFRCAKPAN